MKMSTKTVNVPGFCSSWSFWSNRPTGNQIAFNSVLRLLQKCCNIASESWIMSRLGFPTKTTVWKIWPTLEQNDWFCSHFKIRICTNNRKTTVLIPDLHTTHYNWEDIRCKDKTGFGIMEVNTESSIYSRFAIIDFTDFGAFKLTNDRYPYCLPPFSSFK